MKQVRLIVKKKTKKQQNELKPLKSAFVQQHSLCLLKILNLKTKPKLNFSCMQLHEFILYSGQFFNTYSSVRSIRIARQDSTVLNSYFGIEPSSLWLRLGRSPSCQWSPFHSHQVPVMSSKKCARTSSDTA